MDVKEKRWLYFSSYVFEPQDTGSTNPFGSKILYLAPKWLALYIWKSEIVR